MQAGSTASDASSIVCISYGELARGADLTERIGRAFGPDGLGIIAVTAVPGAGRLRRRVLPLAYRFASLPPDVRAQYEHPGSSYNFGWSHGRETLEGGRPDMNKGSYYANPLHDAPVEDAEVVKRHPSFVHPNIWPDEHVPAFSSGFKELGRAVVDVGILVARQCDKYIEGLRPGYEPGKLARIVTHSKCCKGRLLHYYPAAAVAASATGGGTAGMPAQAPEGVGVELDSQVGGEGAGGGEEEQSPAGPGSLSGWCGFHNDHCSLTGLLPGLFLDSDGKEVENEDPACGLYVCTRQGRMVKVDVPAAEVEVEAESSGGAGSTGDDAGDVGGSGCILFQIGETAQIHSGGALQATPHAVKATCQPGVSRETFAVFMEPQWDWDMDVPRGVDPAEAQSQEAAAFLPRGVPSISSRWRPGMDFAGFTERTLAMFWGGGGGSGGGDGGAAAAAAAATA